MFVIPSTLIAQQDTTAVDVAEENHGLMKYYLRGSEAKADGNLEDARVAFVEGLALFPDSPHLQLAVARISAEADDRDSCLEALTHLATIGGKLDLTTVPELESFLDQKEFKALAETMNPGEPPRPAADSVHTLQGADLWNEGIACDRTTGDLYAGSIKHGKIVRLSGGVQEDFGTTAQDDLLEVLGLHIDEERRRLWTAIGRDEMGPDGKHDFGEMPRENAIVVYDLDTGQQLHKYPMIPDGRIHMWNDVTVAPDGTAYFTDMSVSEIHRIRPGGSPELFLTLEDRNYPNGIAAHPGGELLYVACLEEILVVNLADAAGSSLQRGPDICTGLGDGIAVGEAGLFIVQNNGLLGNRVLQCLLDASGRKLVSAHVLTCALPPGLMPYTCALGTEVLYVNGTAPFAQYDEPGDPPASVIVEIAFEK
jgi:sugar lactone lactonase YvrE